MRRAYVGVLNMPLEVLGPLAMFTAGVKSLPGVALFKTGGAAAAAKGGGLFAAKTKGVFTSTAHSTGGGGGAATPALENAKKDLQRVVEDINEAESKSFLAPFGLLSAFALGGKEDPAVAALRRARAKAEKGEGDRRVRLSTVPDRCTNYGDFL
ncbi:hypothetical protein CSUI_004735 [Cystoisospora suis]|uniref:Uncharacterized protein n=1 Tax=Cystoisospora suis TaxID=483139 RepID=A0A2C6KZY1_9APIC|nr:hypothetical protein CSUI_004735 [Cystoisospora suis]